MAKRILDSMPRAKGAGRMPPTPRSAPRKKSDDTRPVISRAIKQRIRLMILDWDKPRITWEAVLAETERQHHGRWTRQALSNHKVLLKAFQDTKKRLKQEASTGPRSSKPANSSIDMMQGRIRYLQERVAELEKTVEKYKAQFIRWQVNAYNEKGLTIEMLDAPLQPNNRGRSDR
jgi:hypothetical protein